MTKVCTPPIPLQIYSKLLHRIPISSGLTRLSYNQFTNRLFSGCDGLLMAKLLNKVFILVEPNDYHGRILYLFGTNDPKVQHVAQALLCPGDRFLDIGANYSSIGLLAANIVGVNGEVHLFEPQPIISKRVEDAIKAARLTNIYLHKIALMDHDDVMLLARPKDHSGMATLVEHCNQDGWEQISVPVRDISSYVQPIIDSIPFGAKLDVEGAEPFIMPWLLKQPNLKFLIFEAAHNHRELWNLIEASGFVLYGLRRLVFRRQVCKVETIKDMSLYHDLVAVRIPSCLVVPQQINPYRLGKMIKETSNA